MVKLRIRWALAVCSVIFFRLLQGGGVLYTFHSQQEQAVSQSKEIFTGENHNGISTFCLGWNVDSDAWWTHHPTFEVSLENDTHYCFSPIFDRNRARLYQQVYDINFCYNDCSAVRSYPLFSKGWGADLAIVNDGLLDSVEEQVPIVVTTPKPWHYTSPTTTCPHRDLSCYFLNLTKCEQRNRTTTTGNVYNQKRPPGPNPGEFGNEQVDRNWWWLYHYLVRPQTWLRRAVYQYKTKLKVTIPCTAFHVRRGDVALEKGWRRKYYAISDYVNAATQQNASLDHVLLLTDDENAVEEALMQYPELHWMYWKRTRFRGAEGGYENHFPSNDRKDEVIVLLSTFQSVRQCKVLVHGNSHFAQYLYKEMELWNGGPVQRINLDDPAMPL